MRKYQLEGTVEDDARMQKLCEDDYNLVCSEVPEDVKAAYPAATQAVVDLMKKDIDPTFVDNYLEAVTARRVVAPYGAPLSAILDPAIIGHKNQQASGLEAC